MSSYADCAICLGYTRTKQHAHDIAQCPDQEESCNLDHLAARLSCVCGHVARCSGRAMQSPPVISAGRASELDAAAGWAWLADADCCSWEAPDVTSAPDKPPLPSPGVMLVTVGILLLLLLLVEGIWGSCDMLVMPEEERFAAGGVGLVEVGCGAVPAAPGAVLVTVGEVLLMEAASGVMLVMGGWGRVELGWGAVSGLPAAAARSLRPCTRDVGTWNLPAASLCSAKPTRTCLPHASQSPFIHSRQYIQHCTTGS